jgi:uncharacterized protein (TIGR00299 family) protein
MIGWIDASSGASGDMLLGALVDAGVPSKVLQKAVDAVSPEPVTLTVHQVRRNGLRATRCEVQAPASSVTRTWTDVAALIGSSPLDPAVRDRALAAFQRLATSEGAVHGIPASQVHFHEVGALDSIADVVASCAGLHHLALEELYVSAVALGFGHVQSEHGTLPVPPPAVAELLRGRPTFGGPGPGELCTPTGAALLTSQASEFGAQPLMTVDRVGSGAGSRDPQSHANILRLFVGEHATQPATDTMLLMETNVDDMDPRLWPDLIATLIRAGAADTWLTPILMKKGRPAHTLSVLASGEKAQVIRSTIFAQTSTIGIRESSVRRHALARETCVIQVDGHPIRVKLAHDHGALVNAQPEYDDVTAAASATGRPPKQVLADAISAASNVFPAPRSDEWTTRPPPRRSTPSSDH